MSWNHIVSLVLRTNVLYHFFQWDTDKTDYEGLLCFFASSNVQVHSSPRNTALTGVRLSTLFKLPPLPRLGKHAAKQIKQLFQSFIMTGSSVVLKPTGCDRSDMRVTDEQRDQISQDPLEAVALQKNPDFSQHPICVQNYFRWLICSSIQNVALLRG